MDDLTAAEEILKAGPFIPCSVCEGRFKINNCESCMNSGEEVRKGYNEACLALGLPEAQPIPRRSLGEEMSIVCKLPISYLYGGTPTGGEAWFKFEGAHVTGVTREPDDSGVLVVEDASIDFATTIKEVLGVKP